MSIITTSFPAVDTVFIGADESPGQATILSGKQPSDWDERKGYGLTGATLWPKGDPLGTFAIRFDIWLESDYQKWLAYYTKYFAPEAKLITPGSLTPAALTIVHPVLAQLGLQQCVVTDREQLTKDEYGLWSQTIHFKKYKKPVPAKQPSTAVIPAAAVPQTVAMTALERELETKSTELGGLVNPPPTA